MGIMVSNSPPRCVYLPRLKQVTAVQVQVRCIVDTQAHHTSGHTITSVW